MRFLRFSVSTDLSAVYCNTSVEALSADSINLLFSYDLLGNVASALNLLSLLFFITPSSLLLSPKLVPAILSEISILDEGLGDLDVIFNLF